FAKTDTRRNRYVCLLHQQLGKFQGAEMAECCGDRCPCKHCRGRSRDFPPSACKSVDHHVATTMIDSADFFDFRPVAVEGSGCSDLDRCECTVIEIGLHTREGCNQPLITDRKSHAPSRH